MKDVPLFQKNQELTGQVLDLTHEGLGVVKIEDYPFFIEGALPGERIDFKAIKIGRKFGYGKLLKILDESPDRVEMKDNKGRLTGTMTLQHLSYPGQLAFKKRQVQNAFQRIGHFNQVQVNATLGMDEPWQYRNKAQIPVQMIHGQLETGFYRKNSHQLIPVENYYIQDPVIDQAILKIRDVLRTLSIPAYDEDHHTGLIRHIIVKRGHYSGQVMVVLVTKGRDIPRQDQLVAALHQEIPAMVSLMQNINTQKTNRILGQETHCLWGQDFYQDQMLGLTFKISAQSFYQVNTPQAERVYQWALDQADLKGDETVLDAYCGIGTLSLVLAQKAGQVYAMEVVPEAIEMAKQNAHLNQLDNVHFEAGKAEVILPQWQAQGIHFDVAVVDPPRKGLDPDFIKTLIDLSPDRIVYVSCNPATLARDCRHFADAGYQVQTIQPFDLFPQTTHVETCAVLTKSSASED